MSNLKWDNNFHLKKFKPLWFETGKPLSAGNSDYRRSKVRIPSLSYSSNDAVNSHIIWMELRYSVRLRRPYWNWKHIKYNTRIGWKGFVRFMLRKKDYGKCDSRCPPSETRHCFLKLPMLSSPFGSFALIRRRHLYKWDSTFDSRELHQNTGSRNFQYSKRPALSSTCCEDSFCTA